MPSVSGKQHRAMEAAAHGHSTLGIPKSVGEEFASADKGKKFASGGFASSTPKPAGPKPNPEKDLRRALLTTKAIGTAIGVLRASGGRLNRDAGGDASLRNAIGNFGARREALFNRPGAAANSQGQQGMSYAGLPGYETYGTSAPRLVTAQAPEMKSESPAGAAGDLGETIESGVDMIRPQAKQQAAVAGTNQAPSLTGSAQLNASPFDRATIPNPQNAGYLYGRLLGMGLTPVQASAMMGNFQQESSFDPNSWNKREGALGLMQWEGPRLTHLVQYAKANGLDPHSVDAQLGLLGQELSDPNNGFARMFLNSNNLQRANYALKGFIGYGDDSYGTRYKNANNIYRQYGSLTPDQLPKGPAPVAQATPVVRTAGAQPYAPQPAAPSRANLPPAITNPAPTSVRREVSPAPAPVTSAPPPKSVAPPRPPINNSQAGAIQGQESEYAPFDVNKLHSGAFNMPGTYPVGHPELARGAPGTEGVYPPLPGQDSSPPPPPARENKAAPEARTETRPAIEGLGAEGQPTGPSPTISTIAAPPPAAIPAPMTHNDALSDKADRMFGPNPPGTPDAPSGQTPAVPGSAPAMELPPSSSPSVNPGGGTPVASNDDMMYDRIAFGPGVQEGYQSPAVMYGAQPAARGGSIYTMPTNELIKRALDILRRNHAAGGGQQAANNAVVSTMSPIKQLEAMGVNLGGTSEVMGQPGEGIDTTLLGDPYSPAAPAPQQSPAAPAAAAPAPKPQGNVGPAQYPPAPTNNYTSQPTNVMRAPYNNTMDQVLGTNSPTMGQLFGFDYPSVPPPPASMFVNPSGASAFAGGLGYGMDGGALGAGSTPMLQPNQMNSTNPLVGQPGTGVDYVTGPQGANNANQPISWSQFATPSSMNGPVNYGEQTPGAFPGALANGQNNPYLGAQSGGAIVMDALTRLRRRRAPARTK